uniref:Uncharacterized protein n=1 Tax=Lepeophtheirus salmonis TaxID=72036 RepID=A0A0K2U4J4_LEPSM
MKLGLSSIALFQTLISGLLYKEAVDNTQLSHRRHNSYINYEVIEGKESSSKIRTREIILYFTASLELLTLAHLIYENYVLSSALNGPHFTKDANPHHKDPGPWHNFWKSMEMEPKSVNHVLGKTQNILKIMSQAMDVSKGIYAAFLIDEL